MFQIVREMRYVNMIGGIGSASIECGQINHDAYKTVHACACMCMQYFNSSGAVDRWSHSACGPGRYIGSKFRRGTDKTE